MLSVRTGTVTKPAMLTTAIVGMTLGGLATSASGAMVDFNQASDFDEFNNLTTSDTDGDDYSFDQTDGTGGSGAVGVDGNAAVAHLLSPTFDFSRDGTTFNLSQEGFFDADAGGGGTKPGIRVGLTVDDQTNFGSDTVYTTLRGDGAVQFNSKSGGDKDRTSTDTLDLSDDTWYRLESSITTTGTDGVSFSAEVFSLGSDGTATSTSVAGPFTYSDPDGNSTLRGDSVTNASFKTHNGSGFTDLDNFKAAVPEPTSLALLGVGGMLMLGGRRRRTRR